jgi:hypothetical protein
MYFGALVLVPRLVEFVYEVGTMGAAGEQAHESTRLPVNPDPLAVNTQGAIPERARPRCWTRASLRL